MSLNLASIIFESASNFGNQPALIADSGNWTYNHLAEKVSKFAEALCDRGIQKGDRVALMAPNMPAFTVAYFGILTAGAIVVPIHILFTGKEVGFCLKHSGARAMVFWHGVEKMAKAGVQIAQKKIILFQIREKCQFVESPDTDFNLAIQSVQKGNQPFPTMPDDTAVIFYTSGTTGAPKGAEVTHFNLYSNAKWVSEHSLTTQTRAEFWGPGHVTMAVLPLSHSFAQTCMQNAPLLNGGAITYLLRFNAQDLVQKMAQYQVSVMAIVPRIVKELLDTDIGAFNLDAFRYCLVGGAPINPVDIELFEARFEAQVLEGYGLSETSPVIVFRTPDVPRCAGSVGRAISGVQIGVVNERGRWLPSDQKGEIVVSGHAVMKGYYRNIKDTQKSIKKGWFYTGDIGYIDQEQRVFIVDRKKDIIIRSGYTVYPIEVEEVLRTHPKVREVAVVGIFNKKHGEEVKAVVVGSATQDELMLHCKKQLAPFKCPRIYEFRQDLPKGIKGQVLRRLLK